MKLPPELFILSALLIVIFGVIYLAFRGDDRFMKECLTDGRKRYECEAMLRNNYHYPAPLILPKR